MQSNRGDPFHIDVCSVGLNSVELASAIRFFAPSTLLKIQLDSDTLVFGLFCLNTCHTYAHYGPKKFLYTPPSSHSHLGSRLAPSLFRQSRKHWEREKPDRLITDDEIDLWQVYQVSFEGMFYFRLSENQIWPRWKI